MTDKTISEAAVTAIVEAGVGSEEFARTWLEKLYKTGWVLMPLDTGNQLGERFLRAVFDPKFATPYTTRVNAIVGSAAAAKPVGTYKPTLSQ